MGLAFGEVVYIAYKPIFKIYLIIGVGFWLARKNILTVETSKNVSAIAIKVLIPCLAFEKIVTNIHNSDIAEIGTIAIVSSFVMGSGALLCFTFGVLAGCPRNWWGGLVCCGVLPNISDLPIAYLQTMETSASVFDDIDKGVSYVMIYMTLQMLVQFNFGAYKLIEMDCRSELNNTDDEESQLESSSIESNKSVDTPLDHPTIQITPDSNDDNVIESDQNENQDENQDRISELSSVNSTLSESADILNNPIVREATGHSITRRSTLSVAVSALAPLQKVSSIPQHLLENSLVNDAPETIDDIVRVYSRYDDIKRESKENKPTPIFKKYKLETKTAIGKLKHIPKILVSINYWQAFKNIIVFWVSATMQIVSISVILSIIICMIPWVQALFVVTPQASVHSAPDGAPPLSFIMDFASYIGAAEVPFGLLLLGGTIGRLRVNKLPNGLWKVPLAVVFARLFLSPVIGCALNSKLFKDGLFYGEDVLYFISNVNFCLPPATSLIYITAFYIPVDNKPHIQMDCLALVYIANYICLVVCLPFVTTYTMKVSLGF